MIKSGRYVAYYRCSTKGQAESGLGLEAQRAAVHSLLGLPTPQAPLTENVLEPPYSGPTPPRSRKLRAKTQGGPTPPSGILAEIVEQESGKNDRRPKLAEALRLCRMYHATLVVAKTDRLTRNVSFLRTLQESRAKFLAADNPDMNEMTLGVQIFVAQMERQLISQRTKAALAARRARGLPLGRPVGKPHPVDMAKKASAASVAARQAVARERCTDFRREVSQLRKEGITTWAGIAVALNDAGFRAPRGGQWSATQVLRTMAYCEEVK